MRDTQSILKISPIIAGIEPSATLAINELTQTLEAGGRDIIRFGLGQSPFPVPDSVVDSLREHANEKNYLPVKGLPALRCAVSDYHRQEHGLDFKAENILIGPGSKELLFLLQLISGNELMIPRPSWVSYAPQALMVGRSVVWIDTRADENWMLTPEGLAHGLESSEGPRTLLLNYPCNPTGRTFRVETLKSFANLARLHGLLIISDEIYGDIHHGGEHRSIAEFYPEGTIVSSGLSKWCGAGGWRLGTFAFPDSLAHSLEKISAVASETYTATSAPIQYAAVTAFNREGDIPEYVRLSRKLLKTLGGFLARTFRDLGLNVPDPEGGFYLFIDFESFRAALKRIGVLTSIDLAEKLLEDSGVALLPGTAFGCPPEVLTVRLSYVDFDGASALSAMSHLDNSTDISRDFLIRTCPRVIEGSTRIELWTRALDGQPS